MSESEPAKSTWRPPRGDARFYVLLGVLACSYVLLIAAMLTADIVYAFNQRSEVFASVLTPETLFSLRMSLVTCTITAILSLYVAIPTGYLLSRFDFPGKAFIDTLLDVPIFLPPLVIGLSLLILFRQTPLRILDDAFPIALHWPAIIIAQFAVAAAFAVRTLRATFDEISPRCEQVAVTLGCTRYQAFMRVVLPEAWRGIITAATLAWARALGEFGPILVFAGSTRMKTEVLPVSVHLELSIGNIEGAVGVSLVMVVIAMTILGLVRFLGGGYTK